MARGGAVHGRAFAAAVGVLDGRALAGLGVLRSALLGADVRRDGRLSPLLLAPDLQDEPRLPISARLPRDDELAERRALVGVEPPHAPQALRQGRRPARLASRLLVLALR